MVKAMKRSTMKKTSKRTQQEMRDLWCPSAHASAGTRSPPCIAMSLTPFYLTEPVWTSQLFLILRSRGISPESMEGLQNLLLDFLSRSCAQGVVVLAEQWRRTKQYSDAWRAAMSAPPAREMCSQPSQGRWSSVLKLKLLRVSQEFST